MFTYIATNTSNGKFYIGSSIDFEARKRSHLCSKDKYPFQNALRQNPGIFEWQIWEDDSTEPVLEQALLDMWFGKEQCYNLNPVASVPPSWKGRKQSKDHIQKRTKNQKGRVKSAEECQKISKTKKGKPPAWALPDGKLPKEVVERRAAARVANGKKWSKEQRERFGAKRRLPEEEITRRVNLIKESEIDLQKYGSLRKVADLLGLTHTGTRQFLNRYWKD
jgi:group I intron endonuclease